ALGIYIANHHSGAMACKKERGRTADSSSATGNDRDSVSKVELGRAEGHDRRRAPFARTFQSPCELYHKGKKDSVNRGPAIYGPDAWCRTPADRWLIHHYETRCHACLNDWIAPTKSPSAMLALPC